MSAVASNSTLQTLGPSNIFDNLTNHYSSWGILSGELLNYPMPREIVHTICQYDEEHWQKVEKINGYAATVLQQSFYWASYCFYDPMKTAVDSGDIGKTISTLQWGYEPAISSAQFDWHIRKSNIRFLNFIFAQINFRDSKDNLLTTNFTEISCTLARIKPPYFVIALKIYVKTFRISGNSDSESTTIVRGLCKHKIINLHTKAITHTDNESLEIIKNLRAYGECDCPSSPKSNVRSVYRNMYEFNPEVHREACYEGRVVQSAYESDPRFRAQYNSFNE